MNDSPVQIQFALISHTNNGKTTLARTLLGMDVGEVRDAAHVTEQSESHPLLTSAQGDTLWLWDTPGFGDSVRLLKRLALSGNPIGWFLREVLDRYRDRPLWLSQQAMQTARDAADVVLYLVNSAENPKDAGYLAAELKILQWLGKPVVVLLNQMGPPRPAHREQAELSRWRHHLEPYSIVREVLALDAFARCWVHERVLYEAVGELITTPKMAGYTRLLATWTTNNQARFEEAMRLTAKQLMAAAQDKQAIAPESKTLISSALQISRLRKNAKQQHQDQAMSALVERLDLRILSTTRQLLALHRLDPGQASQINSRVRENFVVRAPIDRAQAGLLGAVLSGAATGLSADLLAGGLSLGAGALLGSVVGALTFAGAAWGFNSTMDRNQPSVQFSDAFLKTLLVASVLRYLTVAHFGRGRGSFAESETPAFWQGAVEHALLAHEKAINNLWQGLRTQRPTDQTEESAQALLLAITSSVLSQLYPASTFNSASNFE